MPENLQMISLKLDFIDFVVDEYYSTHLVCEVFRVETLRDIEIEVKQLS